MRMSHARSGGTAIIEARRRAIEEHRALEIALDHRIAAINLLAQRAGKIKGDWDAYCTQRPLPGKVHFSLRMYVLTANVLFTVFYDKQSQLQKVSGYLTNTFIILSCITASINSYQQVAGSTTLIVIETAIVAFFRLELLLRLIAESTTPYRFWSGWHRRWNIFDSIIVAVTFVNENLSYLRCLRLVKLMYQIRSLRALLAAVLHSSVRLLFMAFVFMLLSYMYAVIGTTYLRETDFLYWGSLQRSCLTLFQIATLDNWSRIFYRTYAGCNTTNSIYGITKRAESLCNADSHPQPLFGVFFYISFVIAAIMVMTTMVCLFLS